jgi:hypothetical protein
MMMAVMALAGRVKAIDCIIGSPATAVSQLSKQ